MRNTIPAAFLAYLLLVTYGAPWAAAWYFNRADSKPKSKGKS